jgi:hypothetical protein
MRVAKGSDSGLKSAVRRICSVARCRFLSLLLMFVAVSGGAAFAQSKAPPYPASPVIKSVVWAPANEIVRRARDGDNWPVTWGNDDALYTTWGDGTGFAPKVEKKLTAVCVPR